MQLEKPHSLFAIFHNFYMATLRINSVSSFNKPWLRHHRSYGIVLRAFDRLHPVHQTVFLELFLLFRLWALSNKKMIFDHFRHMSIPKPTSLLPDECSKYYNSPTINSRDLKFGRFMEDNACSNLIFYQSTNWGHVTHKLGQSSKS